MATDKKAASRQITYAEKTPSTTWLEEAGPQNPYAAQAMHCHGYDLVALAENKSFVDVIYLLIKGELPDAAQANFLNRLLVAFIMPGPRHPAARAAAAAGLGRSMTANILPVALSVASGERNAAADVENAMRFIVKHRKRAAADVLAEATLIPGTGQLYGGRDLWADALLQSLLAHELAGDSLRWLHSVQQASSDDSGVLASGVFAAAACDMGLRPAQGLLLYQLACAPGLAFHGLEFAGRALNAVPFVADDNYFFDDD